MKTARELAAERGQHIYHTGKPCPSGHNDGRYTRTAGCVTCAKERAADYQRTICAKLDAAKAGSA